MATATLTSKGQITLPKAVRERLGVKTGDRIAFRVQDSGAVMVEAETVDLRSLRGILKSRFGGVTVEQMDEAVRRGASRRR